MGEWSRRIGEAGENLVAEYFKLIGWADAQKDIEMPCVKPEKHTQSSTPRRTHGIDFLFSYVSPLADGTLNNIVASVKFTTQSYPERPSVKFKEYFGELAETLECFKNSAERRAASAGRMGINRVQDIGVLFWLNSAKNSEDDIVSRVARAPISDAFVYDSIYIVDNKRVAFVYDALQYAMRLYKTSEIEFFYFDTGKNINPLVGSKNGPILPVEFINANVLPLRIAVSKTEAIVLMLFLIDEFSEENLRRLIGLAQKLSGNWASKTILCFPDFFPLQHENIVQRVKASFSDKKTTRNLEVSSYSSDFRNLHA